MTEGAAGPEHENAEAPLRRLLDVAANGEWYDRIELADGEGHPEEVYRALVDDDRTEVLACLAQKPRAQRETFSMYSRGGRPSLASWSI